MTQATLGAERRRRGFANGAARLQRTEGERGMQDWEKKFDSVALGKGKDIFDSGKISELKKSEEQLTAAIMGIPRYEVSITLKNGDPIRMKCQCPKYRSGRSCEHMAAVLYAAYGDTQQNQEKQNHRKQDQRKWDQDENGQLNMFGELEQQSEKPPKPASRKAKAAAVRKTAEETGRKAARESQKKETGSRRRAAAEEAQKKAAEESQKKAAEEAARKAEEEKRREEEEEAAREAARREVKERIARREELKKAKKAERKRKRQEAERIQKEAVLEAARKKEEEEKRAAEEAARKAAEEAKRKEAERAARRAAQEEAARRKEQKIQAAIARASGEETELQADEVRAEQKVRKLQEDDNKMQDRIQDTDGYCYYDFKKLKKLLKLSKENIQKGEKLYRNGSLRLEEISGGYTDSDEDLVMDVTGVGRSGKKEFANPIVFTREKILHHECSCPECSRNRYGWYYDYRSRDCAYMAALLEAAEEQVRDHGIGDATDRTGAEILYSFQRQHENQVFAKSSQKEASLKLEPRLQEKEGRLLLSFRIGEEKLFVVKELFEFCRKVRNSETGVYGSSTEFNHQLSNFTPESQEWYHFIDQAVRDEAAMERRLEEKLRYSYGKSTCSALEMYGWRLDRLYELLQDKSIEYEKKTAAEKIKERLRMKESDPRITLKIKRGDLKGDNTFHGIEVSGKIPEFFHGTEADYYVEKGYLCRAGKAFMEQLRPLERMSEDGFIKFRIGRGKLSEFYYSVLPVLRECAEISEADSEEIHAYLPPEPRFVFYLDAEKGNMTCRLHAVYGDREVMVFDILDESGFSIVEPFRMKNREAEIFYHARKYFPEIDIANDILHCGSDEELMYQVLEHGVEELMEYGEVNCTQRFRQRNLIRRVKTNVGVSVKNGLLDLEIVTEDIPREELLEILRGYHVGRKFYRLKNGDFLSMEDNTLKMLKELMDTLRLSPKEFVKGSFQIPAYRTLYLDKLLEENENIYSTRDSVFREMVKNFKTINDADFTEPASLARIMRGYQRNGYKWLRTLAFYGFGGILADDMGLGKTLQMIAVLFAAKEEGNEGCSLIVSPSSLVYNWEEEFYRFAPALKVLIVAGGQEARREKLKGWQDYDVLITSYDLLKRDIMYYEEMTFQYEVIDEAQYIKNHTTAAAKAVKVVKSKHRFALTGTPIENRLSELWSIFDYLMPGFLYGYDVFRKELETPIAKNSDEEAMKRLQKMTAPFILRRLKKDVLKDLPDKLEEIRYVQMEEVQRRAYDAQVVQMQTQLSGQSSEDFNKNRMQIFAQLTRLRQICCDPSLCFTNYTGESAKLEACLELIRSAMDGGHKILLFSQFTTMLEILQSRLDRQGIAYYTITGATPKEKRLQSVKSFNEDETPLFLISLKAGGVGLNLTGADVVIHYDPWWNLAVQEQATDRAHRIGQTKKVTVYKLIVRHTVEEKIQKLQETKRDLADSIVNEQTGQLTQLNKEELLELLEA